VMLPPEVDATQARADYSGGFLEIVLPIRPRSTSKRIPISPKDEGEGGGQE
jgi:HSP20 family molecular chaperone IbpA